MPQIFWRPSKLENRFHCKNLFSEIISYNIIKSSNFFYSLQSTERSPLISILGSLFAIACGSDSDLTYIYILQHFQSWRKLVHCKTIPIKQHHQKTALDSNNQIQPPEYSQPSYNIVVEISPGNRLHLKLSTPRNPLHWYCQFLSYLKYQEADA